MSCELDMCITLGDIKHVKIIIKNNPKLINESYATDEQTPLMTAVVNEENKIIDYLLKRKASVTEPILRRASGIQNNWQFGYPVMDGISDKYFDKLLHHADEITIHTFASDYPTCKLKKIKLYYLKKALWSNRRRTM